MFYIKFGMCLPASDYARINRVGADYIELGAGSIYRMSDDSFGDSRTAHVRSHSVEPDRGCDPSDR